MRDTTDLTPPELAVLAAIERGRLAWSAESDLATAGHDPATLAGLADAGWLERWDVARPIEWGNADARPKPIVHWTMPAGVYWTLTPWAAQQRGRWLARIGRGDVRAILDAEMGPGMADLGDSGSTGSGSKAARRAARKLRRARRLALRKRRRQLARLIAEKLPRWRDGERSDPTERVRHRAWERPLAAPDMVVDPLPGVVETLVDQESGEELRFARGTDAPPVDDGLAGGLGKPRVPRPKGAGVAARIDRRLGRGKGKGQGGRPSPKGQAKGGQGHGRKTKRRAG